MTLLINSFGEPPLLGKAPWLRGWKNDDYNDDGDDGGWWSLEIRILTPSAAEFVYS